MSADTQGHGPTYTAYTELGDELGTFTGFISPVSAWNHALNIYGERPGSIITNAHAADRARIAELERALEKLSLGNDISPLMAPEWTWQKEMEARRNFARETLAKGAK
jgi:hypothetical protein